MLLYGQSLRLTNACGYRHSILHPSFSFSPSCHMSYMSQRHLSTQEEIYFEKYGFNRILWC